MTYSWRARRPVDTPTVDTIADGIAARVPVPAALELMLEVVDDMLLVDDASIVDATARLTEALPLAIEPSAGAGWAAARQQPPAGPIGLILTGGNIGAANRTA